MPNKKISELNTTTSITNDDIFVVNHLGSTNNISYSTIKNNLSSSIISVGFDAQLTSSGYQKFPSGLIMQWGKHDGHLSDTNTEIILPITFNNAFLNVTSTCYKDANAPNVHVMASHVFITSLSSFRLYGGDNGSVPSGYYWQALGY